MKYKESDASKVLEDASQLYCDLCCIMGLDAEEEFIYILNNEDHFRHDFFVALKAKFSPDHKMKIMVTLSHDE